MINILKYGAWWGQKFSGKLTESDKYGLKIIFKLFLEPWQNQLTH